MLSEEGSAESIPGSWLPDPIELLPGEDPSLEGENPEEEEPEGITESELLRAVQQEISDAEEDLEMFEDSIGYYNAEYPNVVSDTDDDVGLYDSLVSADVRNAVEDTLAEVMPGFYGDSPVVFTPVGPGDETKAMQETKIINHVFLVACKGYNIMSRAFKDALICKNAVAKIVWDTKKEVRGQRHLGVPEDMLATFQNISAAEKQDDGTWIVDTKEITVSRSPKVEWVPVDQLLVNRDHDDVDLDGARFVCHRRTVPASDLVAAGIDKDLVDSLTDSDGSSFDLYARSQNMTSGSQTGHRSTRSIVIAESYYMIDTDGDGIVELNRVITGGGDDGAQKLLWHEPYPEQPFACGVAFFSPRGWRGVSLEERLRSIQVFRTDMIRQILDAGWRNLNQRMGVVERMANIEDIRSSKRGGIIRLKDPSALVPVSDVQLPAQVFSIIQLLDQMRRESGAGAIDTAPQVSEMGVDSAHGIERIISVIEQANAVIAKNLAETFMSQVYKKLHGVIRRHWPGVIMATSEGSWLQAVPQQWAERHGTDVIVGLSAGARARQSQALSAIMQMQDASAAAGNMGTLVNEAGMYQSRIDLARLSGIKNPEKYWIDPSSQEAQKARQAKQQAAEQQMQMQKESAREQAMLQAKILEAAEQVKAQSQNTIAEIRAQTDKYKADLQHIQKTVDQRLKLIELNADYDHEKVPGGVEDGSSK